ncbi:hypothetical protein AAH020_19830, partial [Bacteroides fragilis]|uniref:hypothetical protein n=1 Tax=Bacteroides fragilis TaxID=817 RepID=UPI0039B627F5
IFCKFTLLEPYKQLYYNILIYRTPLKSSTARYIKLVIPDGVGNGTVAAIRELDVRGTVVN